MTTLKQVNDAMESFNRSAAPGSECNAWQDFVNDCYERLGHAPWQDALCGDAVPEDFATYWGAVAEGRSEDYEPMYGGRREDDGPDPDAVRALLKVIGDTIKAATSLAMLRELLNEFERVYRLLEPLGYTSDFENELTWAGVDMCALPTFGGHQPLSTEGIWSWDADDVLLVTDEHVWTTEPRVDVNIDTHGHTAADTHY